ncbi:hypothetical protein GCM10010377_79310 [Streptomyces viridiviolaceus]|nr:hypothetical protein GCM10010377_79310 [Streptomyces viridiviolaceus]
MAEGFTDVPGPQRSGHIVEDAEDAGVVRVLGQVRWGSRKPVGETLPCDREVFEVCLRLLSWHPGALR